MTWMYKGSELKDEDIPEKSIGFIYLLTNTSNGKKYVGRKLLTKAHTRQKNKKIIRSRVESDWREYWSSSPEILKIIEEEGTKNFIREIMMFVPMKGHLMYFEEKLQYCLGVLESDKYYNTNIRAKIFKRNVLNKVDTEEFNSVLHSLT